MVQAMIIMVGRSRRLLLLSYFLVPIIYNTNCALSRLKITYELLYLDWDLQTFDLKFLSYGDQQHHATEAEDPTVDIIISNVVCTFSVRCHLDLHKIALSGSNVEYRRENGMLTMKLRKPYTTASIWSSGKITCTGATSEDCAKLAARKFCRILQKMGHNVKFANYRVVNVLGTCSMPFDIRLPAFAEKHSQISSYEPELHPGITFKVKEFGATLKIFSTGSITITAPSVSKVQSAVEHIFPLVYEFQKPKAPKPQEVIYPSSQRSHHNHRGGGGGGGGFTHHQDFMEEEEEEEYEDFGSENSWH
ncbi:TBPL1 [Cordylochernes scorpioides]|uniref:TATA box-binding protein-like 1 n=1 Tax=Cordylochernes scorpioides TaxID=51811 RepID=A0ABY6L853_9ARAC|nr:TBPL1 [Cordylochernes scorpioides]